MARAKAKAPKVHAFRDKLVLNQWLLSLFGIDPLAGGGVPGQPRPFRHLADLLKDPSLEGLDKDNLHRFYSALVDSDLFGDDPRTLSKDRLLAYEENISRHTQAINARRRRPVVWKYFQWLTLLFVEIYLDRFFGDREGLLRALNAYVTRFNQRWHEFANLPLYQEDDLNKLCFQNATGSGKTLLMHVNLRQYRHYANRHGQGQYLSRVILLTPNERLSEQHIAEFRDSSLSAEHYLQGRGGLFDGGRDQERVDVLEITKLADQDGPNTIATRNLGDQNLLLVDEGHRGMSGKEEGAWYGRRAMLCARGFTFEYSATFEQAVRAAGNPDFENGYAKAVLFDYSYRWFYEDGFGKDYQILNLPASFTELRRLYLTACLLKFYQQLRIYEEGSRAFQPFNLEKPLWVFVGSTVSSGKLTRDEQIVAADVALIVQFIAEFLADPVGYRQRIDQLLIGTGEDTGLVDQAGNDIFAGAFTYLATAMNAGETGEALYRDILTRLFNHAAGGHLALERIKGESGEVALRVGTSETPFGLINVGDARSLCDHVARVAAQEGTPLRVADSDFSAAMFATVKDSGSPVNLLIGSKKFVEGWDCWRVSTLGLMHVGRSEGAQIIQLFGRGVRLKGYEWSLKRSGHARARVHPPFIEELETLNVFGIEADFMEKFRDFLRDEGLPGNERRHSVQIPLNVTYDFGKKLMILRPKRKAADGEEYDFKRDGPVPSLGEVPAYLTQNKVVADWYPRIQALQSQAATETARKEEVTLQAIHLALLNFDQLYFDLERFKGERAWHNLNITKAGLRQLLEQPTWYSLFLPTHRLRPTSFDGVRLLQEVATELLKRYCDRYYNYCKRAYLEPRLELRELTRDDALLPQEDSYQISADGDEAQLILGIEQLKAELAQHKKDLVKAGDLEALRFNRHLFQPLLHVRHGGKISVLPVALNDSEFRFVTDLRHWCDANKAKLAGAGRDLFLLRNLSRGKGVGFFEAGNFHPDFILWLLTPERQFVTFIEPHGLLHEGPASEKVLFYRRIKEVERRLNDPGITLNSFILSWTQHPQLQWGLSLEELAARHVLFMTDDADKYLDRLFGKLFDQEPPS